MLEIDRNYKKLSGMVRICKNVKDFFWLGVSKPHFYLCRLLNFVFEVQPYFLFSIRPILGSFHTLWALQGYFLGCCQVQKLFGPTYVDN